MFPRGFQVSLVDTYSACDLSSLCTIDGGLGDLELSKLRKISVSSVILWRAQTYKLCITTFSDMFCSSGLSSFTLGWRLEYFLSCHSVTSCIPILVKFSCRMVLAFMTRSANYCQCEEGKNEIFLIFNLRSKNWESLTHSFLLVTVLRLWKFIDARSLAQHEKNENVVLSDLKLVKTCMSGTWVWNYIDG